MTGDLNLPVMTCHGYRSRQRLGVGTSRRWDIVPHRIIRSKLRPLHRCSPVAAPVADIEDREIGETNKRPVSDISACPRDAGRLCLPDVRCDVLGIASALMMMMLVMPVGGQALADTAPLLPDTLTETYRGGEQHQGFRFSYPDSFVIAFDRTGSKTPKGNGEVALVSVGDFKKFITVTVFGSRMDDGEETPTSIVDVDTGYDVCIRPIVESETTMGSRVIREEMKNVSGVGVFDFEYDHSICRGEQIESSGGILRCIVRECSWLDT